MRHERPHWNLPADYRRAGGGCGGRHYLAFDVTLGWLLRSRVGRAILAAWALVLALLAAWFGGKREGHQQAAQKRAEDNAKASQKAKENRNEIESSDDQRLVDILTGKLHDKR